MNQTAVEWLVEQLKDMEYDLRLIPNTIELAKAMEKEQIKRLFEKHYDETGYISMTLEDAERYYNESYGKSDSS